MNYYTAIDSLFNNMNYKVQPGDTLDTISKKLGVQKTAITGYKSQDPNLIMPGEELTVNNLPKPGIFTPPVPGNFQVPTDPAQPEIIPSIGTDRIQQITQKFQQMLPTPPVTPQAPQQAQPIPTVTPTQQPTPMGQIPPFGTPLTSTRPPAVVSGAQETVLPQKFSRTFSLPSGQQLQMDVTPEVDALLGGEATRNNPTESNQATQQISTFFGQYGVDSGKLSQGFTANPVQTLTTLTDHVMKSMQIPDAITNISNITKQIETLSNERDDEIQQIQDNPWKSAGSKAELIAKISDKYERRITNRTNSLTLLQNAYQEARQQAQFAITTAVGLYDKQRAFDQKSIEDALNRQEASAKTALDIKKFEEDKRQFGLTYALKQQEMKQKEEDAGEIISGIQPVEVKPIGSPTTGEFKKGNLISSIGKLKLSEGQANATAYAIRLIEANKNINDLVSGGKYDPTTLTASIGRRYRSDAAKKLSREMENFIRAQLRKESGATITSEELQGGKNIYDPSGVLTNIADIENTASTRLQAIQSMTAQAGPAGKYLNAYLQSIGTGGKSTEEGSTFKGTAGTYNLPY